MEPGDGGRTRDGHESTAAHPSPAWIAIGAPAGPGPPGTAVTRAAPAARRLHPGRHTTVDHRSGDERRTSVDDRRLTGGGQPAGGRRRARATHRRAGAGLSGRPPLLPGPNGFEVEGAGDRSLWALLFLTPDHQGGIPAGREVKIVLRMTGDGDLAVLATGPDGRQVRPQWGPDKHGGSTWTRPGDEWGTGWTFPLAGCWVIRAARADGGTAALTLRSA
ncbi:hypothetical protein [Micromonospora zhanjiangensis]